MCSCVGTTGERGWKGLSLHNLFPTSSSWTVCTAAAALAPGCVVVVVLLGHFDLEASPTGQGLGHRECNPNHMGFPNNDLAIFVVSQGLVATCFPLEVGSHYIRPGMHSTMPFPDIVTSLGIAGALLHT